MLRVVVSSATELPNVETIGKSDPYAVISFQGTKKKTEVIKDELNPVWNEKFEWDLCGNPLSADESLLVQVKDWERIGRNRLLGTASVPLKDLVKASSHTMQADVNLLDGSNRMTQAKISLRMEYIPPKAAKGEGDITATDETDLGALPGDEFEEGEDEDEIEGGGASGVAASSRKRRRKRRTARHKLSQKPQDFQVRVKIIEGRQLSGSNISPVVRVTVANHTRQTKVKHSTNKPFFDETFFFNFQMSPLELFDEIVSFEVFNSRKLRANAMIGYFKSDIGFFYDEPSHAVLRKWVLLTDPDDKMAGVKDDDDQPKGKSRGASGRAAGGIPSGYVKVTVMVLGPGDDAPTSSKASQDGSDDIESNLLQPSGVMLRPAVFSLKIYRAEDIPQMDSGFFEGVKKILRVGEEQKELVDPFLQFTFAGRKTKTRIHYNSDHPEFDEELNVQFKFPSMCERLKIQIFDWDRLTADDCVGTGFLPISAISGQGDDGFLPLFGPCFVNFYGSTREYSDLPDEYDDLNLGIGEGVAYRGRVLVELETKLGPSTKEPAEDLQSHEIIRVQPYLRRRKFKLYACFLEATMVSTTDGPVEFEVSIGNYGNKLDQSVPPSSSTTPPTNAVYDGTFYYYLPWGNTKPCVSVDSHWEDIAFRLDNLNILTRICERLEDNLEKVKLSEESNAPTAETASHLICLLDQLIAACKKPLPKIDSQTPGVNELDLKIQETRVMEKLSIMEEAATLRESATDVQEAIADIEGYLQRLRDLSIEPQNSMPDVVIWMLSGTKRIAYYRIPAADVLFSPNKDSCGQHCSKVLNVFMKYPGKKQQDLEDFPEEPAHMRLIVWLGLEKHQEAWTNRDQVEGDFCVYAETYENEMNVLGNWTSRGLSRPPFSNSRGDVKLPKDGFVDPPGWKFDGDWFVNPELSLMYDRDSGHKTFLEDVFENESRLPGGNWGPSSVPWTDVRGDQVTSRNEITCPEGWEWTAEWVVDLNRAVDEDGYEYTVETTLGGYSPVQKTYHLCRRRRWVRSRKHVKDAQQESEQVLEEIAKEGWEYAPLFSMKFHAKERKMDLVRRRRWHRKMVQEDPSAPAVFHIDSDGGDGDNEKETMMNAPRMFITFEKPHKYQLRAYVYQARDLLASDPDGMSDPYARISFGTQSQVTETLARTICPTWDQSLIFDNVQIYGAVDHMAENPPDVVIELFDKDQVGQDEFMGRCVVKPLVKLHGQGPPSPRLLWYDVERGEEEGGEILCVFELFLDEGADLPFAPPMKGNLFLVPNGVRPVMQRTAIEVLCWGVRNMKKYQLASVSSPCIEFECGGHLVHSTVIKNTHKNPNFDQPLFYFDVYLPKEELYTPPMNIKVRDNRSFGRKPIVGIHSLGSLQSFRCDPISLDDATDFPDTDEAHRMSSHIMDIKEEKKKKSEELEDDIDWWSKFHASLGDVDKAGEYLDKGYDKIMVYQTELEKVDVFNGFQDFVETFYIHRGKTKSKAEEEETVVGEFKGSFRVYPLPSDPNVPLPPKILKNLPPSAPVECLVRLYVVRALDLQPQDTSGLADPYLIVQLGKHKINDKENYIPNCLEPLFGKMFEMTATIPIVKDLRICVMDHDVLSRDDTIGETIVDLENRFLSRYRSTCGVPQTYCTSGPNQWRDSQTPKQILEKYCESNSMMSKPHYLGNTQLMLEGNTFSLQEFEEGMIHHGHLGPPDQRLALHVLNSMPVVPEHVETRPLFNSLQPNIEQGKLQLWVDIFPKHLGTPGPPCCITCRKPGDFQLRVIIWNTSDVILDETSLTGEKMSDIYVKGWLAGVEEPQKTDVHYRSLDGEGNFNWRFVFPFLYLPTEKVAVVRKKEHFWSLDETEDRVPPRLVIQVWDNDQFSPDDFLGQLELNLSCMPKPAKSSRKCGLHQLPTVEQGKLSSSVETVSLFDMKRVYGWWPCVAEEAGEQMQLAGKVEMSIELLTKEESDARPAGTGRDEPNQNPTLEEPNRPATSFRWFTSPLATLRHVIWRSYKWVIIGLIITILLLAAIIVFLYAMPGYSVKKMFAV